MGINRSIRPFEGVASGEKTSSALLDTGPGLFCGVVINTDGSNDATIILYDSLTAANTKIHEQVILAADVTGGFVPWPPIAYTTGLYLSIAGTGASAIVNSISKP